MKWYNVELFDKEEKEKFSRFLKENGVYYECSGCFHGWHFEVKTEPENVEKLNELLENL